MSENMDIYYGWLFFGIYLIFISSLLASLYMFYHKRESHSIKGKVVSELAGVMKIFEVQTGVRNILEIEAPSIRDQTPHIKPCFTWS